MILPDLSPDPDRERESQILVLTDDRVPRPFPGHDLARAVSVPSRAGTPCYEAGRHLWDLLETVGECHTRATRWSTQQFRITGTCVRCGKIWRLEGEADELEIYRGSDQVSPEPLRADALQAQQVTRDTWYLQDPDAHAAYSVHVGTDTTPVGRMVWGATPRQRLYYRGWLDGMDPGEFVEAPTAQACLRKLAKVYAAQVAS